MPREGHQATVILVVQREDCVHGVRPSAWHDPTFAKAADDARKAGVSFRAIAAEVTMEATEAAAAGALGAPIVVKTTTTTTTATTEELVVASAQEYLDDEDSGDGTTWPEVVGQTVTGLIFSWDI